VKSVAWFQEVGKADTDLVGGKGANLGELAGVGLPVPPGFIVTAETYFRFVQDSGLSAAISSLLSDCDVAAPSLLAQTSMKIKEKIGSVPMPASLVSEIEAAYTRLGGGHVAVRSSATAEDLAEASFAGQQSTYLNLSGPAVVSGVQECWASLFEPQAIAYRAQRGYKHLDVGIAVVVQRMVQSERSGVMFTVHPVTGDRNKIVIEAAYGLGEAVVSGEVTPDCYIVDKPSLQIDERAVSPQDRELVRNELTAGDSEPNVWANVAVGRSQLQKLADEQIIALARIGSRVESHYGAPQDIEWAHEGSEFYVVQSRPVTTA